MFGKEYWIFFTAKAQRRGGQINKITIPRLKACWLFSQRRRGDVEKI